jgi:hypothetical protein
VLSSITSGVGLADARTEGDRSGTRWSGSNYGAALTGNDLKLTYLPAFLQADGELLTF